MYIYFGIGLLVLASAILTWGLMWLIAWFNQLSKFIMQIYKDEPAKLQPQYAYMPPIFISLAFLVWRIAEFLLTKVN